MTSYTRFRCQSDEQTVAREFHHARRDAMRTLGGSGKDAEVPARVLTHLQELRHLITTDDQLPQRHRDSLLGRIEQAERDVHAGRGPNRATFTAWLNVSEYVNQAAATAATVTPAASPVAPVTRDEVDAAHTDWRDAVAKLGTTDQRSASRRRVLANIQTLKARYDKLQAAYDVTPRGFNDLYHQYRTRGATDADVSARWQAANSSVQRARGRAAKSAAAEAPLTQLRSEAAEASRAWRSARQVRQATPSPTSAALEERARNRYQAAQVAYLAAIADNLPLPAARDDVSASSVQAWAATVDTDIPRDDMWQAAEQVHRGRAHANAKTGRLTTIQAEAAANRRAEARQAVLDAEGHGRLDPVNTRFRNSLRRKRQSASS